MTLNTPSIYAVDAFDPSYSHTFNFSYSGTQTTSNRAIIIDSESQEEVYNVKQDGLKLNHVLPANTLTAGKSYIIQIQVYDANDNYSNLSSGVLFYCYSTPQFYFSNVNDGDVISSANFELKLTYTQAENEPLNEYKYYLYDLTKELIYTSDSYYTEENLSHTIYGLKNDYIYYVRAVGRTSHNMSVDTGIIQINIKYSVYDSSVAFEAINDRKTGCIIFKTNIVSVGYETENDNYTIENGTVTLSGNTLTYETGVNGDFALIVKAKQLPIGEFLWTTNRSISVSICNICDNYYCRLLVNDNGVKYDILKPIGGATVTDSNGNVLSDNNNQYISVTDSSQYDTENMIVFEIYRINDMYQINASYT